MYLPKHFEQSDVTEAYRCMQENSFCTVITTDEQGRLFASHLPVLVDEHRRIIQCHMARANEQWKHFLASREVLFIFQGPHTFIPSHWYKSPNQVSTWNYIAVHAYVSVRILRDQSEVVKLLRHMTIHFDPLNGMQEFDALDERTRDKMIQSIVAFECDVVKIEAKFKLSQNRSQDEREAVMRALEISQDPQAGAIWQAMHEWYSKPQMP